MRIDILTLFPEMVDAALCASILGRAREAGIVEINCVNIRDFTPDKHRKTDDYPYGGGHGMVMQCEPLFRALEHVKNGECVHTVLLSPQGKVFDQSAARQLLDIGRVILICGHYEGVDHRFIEACVDAEISIGDFVLTGGEIAAMAVADAICRMVPGVLADEAGFQEESHFAGLLEYPQYTRPEIWRGMPVPHVLLSGHHENIAKWRRGKSLAVTRRRRPDMFEKLALSKADIKLLEEEEQ